MNAGFSDATLLLIGHGSTVNTESAGPVYQHAAELRRRQLFDQVREGFWKQEPGIRTVLSELRSKCVFAVPLFISEGYFTEEIIPRELGLAQLDGGRFARVQREQGRTLLYCAPVGTHPSMTGIILSRAQAVLEKHPFPRLPKPEQTALFIAGHGTERNEQSRRSIDEQVRLIRAKQVYGEVHAVFLEEAPLVANCYAMTELKNIVMVPFFISDGLHSDEDIPVLLGEPERVVRARQQRGQPTWRNPTEKKGKLLWYARSVGTEPHLADVILERVKQAAEAP
jgi:sirohydrochlorin cobaltochelatase